MGETESSLYINIQHIMFYITNIHVDTTLNEQKINPI